MMSLGVLFVLRNCHRGVCTHALSKVLPGNGAGKKPGETTDRQRQDTTSRFLVEIFVHFCSIQERLPAGCSRWYRRGGGDSLANEFLLFVPSPDTKMKILLRGS